MLFGNKRKEINWIELTSEEQLLELWNTSLVKPQLSFKHSTRCIISSTALRNVEADWEETEKVDIYLLDLIQFRGISNQIAQLTGVDHESPQLITIKNKYFY